MVIARKLDRAEREFRTPQSKVRKFSHRAKHSPGTRVAFRTPQAHFRTVRNKVRKFRYCWTHFWSTFRSLFSTFYIPFQRSGSQESNASNGAQFGVETKKLQPLQVNHSKMKKAFCKSVAKTPFCWEVISQPFCTVWWISS